MKPLLTLLPVILLAGCVGNPERDCGLYDFDCNSAPTGTPLIQPDATPAHAVVTAAPGTPRQTDTPSQQDLTTRVQLLEEETRRLRRRIEVLEQPH